MSMNINVCVKTPGLKEFTTQVSVRSEETVRVLLDKVAASQLLAFPESSLVVDGKRAEPPATLAAAGVTNGSTVDFVLESTVKSLIAQLGDLLIARALTFDELGLLYCYRHGLSLNQALKTLGLDISLKALVEKHPAAFVVNGKAVSVARKEKERKEKAKAQKLKKANKKEDLARQAKEA